MNRRNFLQRCGLGAGLSALSATVAGQSNVNPGFQFVDVTAAAGLAFRHNNGAYGGKLLPETLGSGYAFLDYDGDGWQDILLINGADWPAAKTTYGGRVLESRTPDEMRRVISLMLGELNASHLGITAPPGGGGPTTGRLGVRFDAAEYARSLGLIQRVTRMGHWAVWTSQRALLSRSLRGLRARQPARKRLGGNSTMPA